MEPPSATILRKQAEESSSAICTSPQLLILDEPFRFADPSSSVTAIKRAEKYNEEHGATVMFSYNLNPDGRCPHLRVETATVRC